MKTPKIAYKVVVAGTLKSCRASTWDNSDQWAVTYKLNEWVSPLVKNSKLLVFDTLENAKSFANNNTYPEAIYKCEVRRVSSQKYISDLVYEVEKFWKTLGFNRSKSCRIQPIVPGTHFASQVKLLELVKD